MVLSEVVWDCSHDVGSTCISMDNLKQDLPHTWATSRIVTKLIKQPAEDMEEALYKHGFIFLECC